jgi:Tol biopolymer transport system component
VISAPVDGGGDIEYLLTDLPGPVSDPNSWARDGRSLLFTYGAPENYRIGVRDTDTMDTDEWRQLVDYGRPVSGVEVHPSGDWLAYWDNETSEVIVDRYPGLGERQIVSGETGGSHPAWSRDGQELYYERSDGAMMAVSIEATTAGLEFGTPEFLFMADNYLLFGPRRWDIDSDGNFLMVKPTGPQQAANPDRGIILVQNWFQELERLAPLP